MSERGKSSPCTAENHPGDTWVCSEKSLANGDAVFFGALRSSSHTTSLEISASPSTVWRAIGKTDVPSIRAILETNRECQQYSGTALGRLRVRFAEPSGKPMGLYPEPFWKPIARANSTRGQPYERSVCFVAPSPGHLLVNYPAEKTKCTDISQPPQQRRCAKSTLNWRQTDAKLTVNWRQTDANQKRPFVHDFGRFCSQVWLSVRNSVLGHFKLTNSRGNPSLCGLGGEVKGHQNSEQTFCEQTDGKPTLNWC